jgi:hypothetical protein
MLSGAKLVVSIFFYRPCEDLFTRQGETMDERELYIGALSQP